jgi:hypothetical protein
MRAIVPQNFDPHKDAIDGDAPDPWARERDAYAGLPARRPWVAPAVADVKTRHQLRALERPVKPPRTREHVWVVATLTIVAVIAAYIVLNYWK